MNIEEHKIKPLYQRIFEYHLPHHLYSDYINKYLEMVYNKIMNDINFDSQDYHENEKVYIFYWKGNKPEVVIDKKVYKRYKKTIDNIVNHVNSLMLYEIIILRLNKAHHCKQNVGDYEILNDDVLKQLILYVPENAYTDDIIYQSIPYNSQKHKVLPKHHTFIFDVNERNIDFNVYKFIFMSNIYN